VLHLSIFLKKKFDLGYWRTPFFIDFDCLHWCIQPEDLKTH